MAMTRITALGAEMFVGTFDRSGPLIALGLRPKSALCTGEEDH
jgi:hypothetical protein